jgi:hypothetical protein
MFNRTSRTKLFIVTGGSDFHGPDSMEMQSNLGCSGVDQEAII